MGGSGLTLAPGHPLYGRARTALALVGIAALGLMYTPQPLLPMIAEHYSLSAASTSWLISAVTLGVAVGVVPLGAASARWGRGRMIIVGLATATVAGISLGIFSPWWALVVARFIQGLGIAAVLVSAMAWVVDNALPHAVTRIAALYIAATTMGGMGGRVLSGALTDLLGSWQGGLLASSALLAVLGGIAHYLLPRADTQPARVLDVDKADHDATVRRAMYVLGLTGMAVHAGVYNAAAFRAAAAPFDLGPSSIGLLFLAYAAGTVTSAFAGRAAARIPARVIHVGGLASAGMGITISLVPQLWALILGLVLLSGGFFAMHALANSTAARLSPQPSAGAARYNLLYYLGASVGAIVFALAWDSGGWAAVTLLALGLLSVAATVAWIWAPKGPS